MAKRKKTELETTSVDTTSSEQQEIKEINNVNKEVIEDNKNEKTNEKTTKKKNVDNTIKEKEYIITKKSEGVYIRKLRRLWAWA